jgi:hypothetical protein
LSILRAIPEASTNSKRMELILLALHAVGVFIRRVSSTKLVV